MDIEIGGIKRKAKVLMCPKGFYCSMKEYDGPYFPLSIAVCEPQTDAEREIGDVLFVPMFECTDGYEIEWANTLRNEVYVAELRAFAVSDKRNEGHKAFSDIVSSLVTCFKEHGVALSKRLLIV